MNSTFKVVFNKARGALMVVNEVTSSVQAKGTKTVVATAVAAMIAGVAQAETAMPSVWADTAETAATSVTIAKDKTETVDVTQTQETVKGINTKVVDVVVDGGKLIVKDGNRLINWANKGTLTVKAGEVTVTGAGSSVDVQDVLITGGTVTVGDGTNANWFDGYKSFTMTGGTVNVKANSEIVIGAEKTPDANGKPVIQSMELKGGTINLDGQIRGSSRNENYGAVINLDGSTIAVAKTATDAKIIARNVNLKSGAIDNKGKLTITTIDKPLNIAGAEITNSGELIAGNVKMTAGKITNVKTTGTDAVTGSITFDEYEQTGGTFANAGAFTADKITVSGGTFTNTGSIGTVSAGSTDNTNLFIAGNFDNSEGGMNVNSVTIKKGGVLKTSSWNADSGNSVFHTKSVTIDEGGTLNFTTFNANWKKANNETVTGTAVNDFILFERNLTLNGGALQYNGSAYTGNFKFGKNAAAAAGGTLTWNINAGDYTFDNVYVQKTSTLNVAAGASLTTTGDFKNRRAAIVLDGTMTVAGELINEYQTGHGSFTINETGVLNVTLAGIDLKFNDSGVVVAEETDDFSAVLNKGSVNVSGIDKKLSLTDVATIKSAINGENSTGFVGLGNATVDLGTTGKNEDGSLKVATANALAGVRVDDFKNATVGVAAGESGSLTGGSFGAIALGEGSSVEVASGILELNGAAGTSNLVSNKDGKAGDIKVMGTLVTKAADGQLGTVTGEGTLNVAEGKLTSAANASTTGYHGIDVGTLNVAEGAALESKGTVKIQTAGNIAGSATIGTLEGTTTATVNVGDSGSTGALVVDEVKSVKIFADPAWDNGSPASTVAVKTLTSGSVEAGRNSYVAVGTNDINVAKAALAKTGYKLADVDAESDLDVQGVAYVAAQSKIVDEEVLYTPIAGLVLASGKTAVAGTADTGSTLTTVNGTDVGGMMIIDVATVDKSETPKAVFAESFTNNGILYLANAVNGDKFDLTDGTYTAATNNYIRVAGGRMIGATAASDGVVTVAIGEHAGLAALYGDLDTFETTYAAFENGAVNGGSSSQRFATWLFEEEAINGLVVDGERNDIVDVGNAVAYIGATAGLANVTMDAVSEFNDSVAARTSILAQRGEGVNVWVDVNGGKFEGKKVVDGEVGYSSDLYGAVLGADVTVACGATVGAAVTVGTADTDNKGDTVKTSVDTDFVGIGLYANKPIGEVANVAFDLGYIQASNELSVKEFGIGKTDADTDAVTFGVRGELLAKVGAIDVVPHVGLRWTRLSFDQFEAGYVTDIDSMNVFQMPVGVTFKGDVEVEGWNIAPAFDLTFTPTWGDKDMEQKVWVAGSSVKDTLEATRVLDNNVVNATLGVSAQNGAWTFGLDYKLGVGSDDRMNNSFNARVNYAF